MLIAVRMNGIIAATYFFYKCCKYSRRFAALHDPVHDVHVGFFKELAELLLFGFRQAMVMVFDKPLQ